MHLIKPQNQLAAGLELACVNRKLHLESVRKCFTEVLILSGD